VEINLVEMVGNGMDPSKYSSKGKGLADDRRETCGRKCSEKWSFTMAPVTEWKSIEKLARKESMIETEILRIQHAQYR
jgi:hypothetical protein